MASCLDSLIGQDNGCASTTGTLYLKDIGITQEFITTLLAKHNANTADFMAERRRLASEYVVRDVVNHLDRFLIGRTFVDHDRLGKWPDTEALTTSDAGYHNGVLVEVCTPASNTVLSLTRIEFYGETTGPVEVTVYDLKDGSVVEQFDVDAVAGQVASVEVNINLQVRREKRRLFVTTDQDTFYKATMSAGCPSCKPTHYRHGPLDARSVRFLTTDKKVYANVATAPNTGGLSVVASVSCDHAAMLCEMKSAMALPLIYALGREVFTTALYNFDRWGIKDIRKDDVEKRRDELEALYSKSMADVLKWIAVPNDPSCFVCDKKISTGVILP
jgi:hypothetical protein